MNFHRALPAAATLATISLTSLTALGIRSVVPADKPLFVGEDTLRKGFASTPTNQLVTPIGNVITISGSRPKDIAVSPDGKRFAALCQGGVTIFSAAGESLGKVNAAIGPLGIAWMPDGKRILAAQSGGKISVIDVASDGRPTLTSSWVVDTPLQDDEAPDIAAGLAGRGQRLKDPQVAGIAVSTNGKTAFVALGIRNAIAVIDTETGTVTRTVRVDVAPYHVALSADGKRLAVSCRGGRVATLTQPHAPSAGTAVRVDTTTDAALNGSVVVIDTAALRATQTITGIRQPGKACFTTDGKTLLVPGTDDDMLWTLDLTKAEPQPVGMPIAPNADSDYGHIPTAVTLLSEDRIAVACGGANAIAIIDTRLQKVTGYIPTGWYPIALATADGNLVVANAKGIGGRVKRSNGAYNVHGTIGTIQVVPLTALTGKSLDSNTRQVAANNRWNIGAASALPPRDVPAVPVPERVGEPSVFEHVVYIIKENQTYDSLLGDMKDGNGDPKLCLFGEDVSPNHHALAREFVLLDNTYTSGTNSADGHQWTVSAIGNGYIEQNYDAHSRSYPYDGGDPLAYSPKGFLWTSALAAGKSLRIYGEFVNKPTITNTVTGKRGGWKEIWDDYRSGGKVYKMASGTDNATIRPYLHPEYIGFPSVVSDQWRADVFIKDMDRFDAEGKMPNLSIMLLPNDHTSGTREGTPTPRATVADNDLALGRIVERITKSKFWSKTLILVIEDDSQLGIDHVDGHRTTALCISPYTRRGVTVSEQYNHTGFIRTMGLVLGLPALNRFDATATPLTKCFTTKADVRPYTVKQNRIPLDELNAKVATLTGISKQLAIACGKMDWDHVDRADGQIVTRAVWNATKPGKSFPLADYRPVADTDGDDD
jgi:WD40 repeat protein